MNFIPLTQNERQEMLERIGVDDIETLYSDVPSDALLKEPVAVEGGYDEYTLSRKLKSLAAMNQGTDELISFMGGGMYDHVIPALVDQVLLRPEFFTAYTPYQPEVSQGSLQAIFEYQTAICHLSGMDLANASLYDGATAVMEAAFMAVRLARKRNHVVVAGSINPDYLETLATYVAPGQIVIDLVEPVDGHVSPESLIAAIDDTTAAVIVGYPEYQGSYVDYATVADAIHAHKGLLIAVADPIMLALAEPPRAWGADVFVGEGQALGNPSSFGGPGLGLFACTKECMRQMPGRIVGRTVDQNGDVGYVLTLSTREQHIRREKATSNICSNHALNALAAGAYLAALGTTGLTAVAQASVDGAHYLASQLIETGNFKPVNTLPFGYEFALDYNGDAERLHSAMLEKGFLAGLVIGQNRLLFAVTEKRTKEEIDLFVKEVAQYGC